jgi:hypothetical protein
MPVGVVGALAIGGLAIAAPVQRASQHKVNTPVTVKALGTDHDAPAVGDTVTAGATLVAERRQTFDSIVIAVRDEAGRNHDFPAQSNWKLGTRQRDFTASRTFEMPGVYTYWVAYRAGDRWIGLEPKQTFTVGGDNVGIGPAPTPKPKPTRSPRTGGPKPTPSPNGSTSTPPVPPAPPGPGKGFPNAANTGVRADTTFAKTVGTTEIKTAGQVIDRWHITGSLVIKAANVKITNSQIDDSVLAQDGGSFTITDSTVGPAKCGTSTWMPMGIGSSNYTAVRVHVRGHEDGFRASGPKVVIRDSYYKACAPTSEHHADGIQDYPAASGLILDHNTFDMTGAVGYTSPIFVHSTDTVGAMITNNLAIGGVYAVYLEPTAGQWVVTGNRVVAGTANYGAYEAEGKCRNIGTWADNDVVTIDSNYSVTGTVRDNVTCEAGN